MDVWVDGLIITPVNIDTLGLHLASWNLLDSQLCRESKMEPSMVYLANWKLPDSRLRTILTNEGGQCQTEKIYTWRGATAQKTRILGGGTPHILS